VAARIIYYVIGQTNEEITELTALNRLVIAFGMLLLIVTIGTIGFEEIEGLTHFESFYLTVCSITTVGYGDIVPVTTAGRILAMCLIVSGFAFFTTVVVTAVQVVFERREDARRAQQLQTLITLFYSEVGDRLIRLLSGCDPELPCIQEPPPPEKVWTTDDYADLAQALKNHSYTVDLRRVDPAKLSKILDSQLLLTLLENPQVFNHTLFNRLLREIFHVKGELTAHEQFNGISKQLHSHLAADLAKIYQPAVKLWLEHMKYLEKAYPSLFMTALETNPFGVAKTEPVCPPPFPIDNDKSTSS
jgi:voltage-gated potassium channel